MRSGIRNIILLLCLLTWQSSLGQERHLKKGDAAYEAQNYVEAVDRYKKALPAIKREADPIVVQDLVFKIADSYLQMNQFEKALPWFKEATGSGIFSEKIFLKYARTLTLNNKADEAAAVYREIRRRTGNTYSSEKIAALEAYDDTTHTAIDIRNQYDLNSKYSDYSPSTYKSNIVFSSSRPLEKKGLINKRTSQNYSNLYIASYNSQSGKWGDPRPLEELLNSRKSEGVFTYSPATNQAFFMQCRENDKKCVILTTKPGQEGGWTTSQQVTLNVDGTIGHPAVSADGRTLYFVSDMPGGYGGKDIWKVSRVDEYIWGIPVNLGPTVNTSYDEVFPSVSGDTLLFFASDRPDSYGGLDFYISRISGDDYTLPSHPGYPFNTLRDDFGIMFSGDGGLFTSNRNNIVQSDDIFAFSGFPGTAYLKGRVLDKNTGAAVGMAEIKLQSGDYESTLSARDNGAYTAKIALQQTYTAVISAPGYRTEEQAIEMAIKEGDIVSKDFLLAPLKPAATIEGTVRMRDSKRPMKGETVVLIHENTKTDSAVTGESGVYRFSNVASGKTYTIKISKEGFFSESRELTIPEMSTSSVFSKDTGYDTDFLLTLIEKEKEIVINNIFYDFNKATLRPESKKELNKLLSMLRETPQVIIQINAHTDARGKDAYNRRLSQRRAQGVADYLTARGISPDRLFARGYGESQLLVNNATTEAEHQLNRRTTFKVLAVLEEKSSETPEQVELKTPAADNNDNQHNPDKVKQDNVTFRVQLLASSKKLPDRHFSKLTKNISNVSVFVYEQNGIYKYEIGLRSTYRDAVDLRQQIVRLGHQDCFITAYHQNQRIPVTEALKIEKR